MTALKSRLVEMKPAFALIYLSLMGCLCTLSVQAYMGLKIDPWPCLSFMSVIFGVYTFNRFTDIEEDFTTDIGRLLFFQKKKFLLLIALAGLAASTALMAACGKLNWMHVVLLCVGFAYSYRIVPRYTKGRGLHLVRIKEMTFIKNLAVSLLWGGSVFLIPILYSGRAVATPFVVVLLAAGLSLSTFNNTLFDDIRDEAGDRVAGIRTLPTAIGGRRAAALLWILDGLWLGFVAWCGLAARIDAWHWAFLSLLGAYPLIYVGLSGRSRVSEGWIEFVAESDLLIFSVGLAALSRLH
jgi:4-hydroxybenzoate polyprenyltransferase